MVGQFLITKKTHLLVLGAGYDQLFAIKKALQKGYEVTAVDKNPNAVGKKVASNFYAISNRDINSIDKLIKNFSSEGNPINGIFLMGADIPNVAAELCLKNGLPSISVDSASIAQNKILMKKNFAISNIPIPAFHILSDIEDLKKFIKKYKKVVIKPSDSSGSRGVALLSSKTSEQVLVNSFNDAFESSNEKKVLLEEFIEGPQLSSESIILNGKAITYGYADRNYELMEKYAPNIVENGGIQPSIQLMEYFPRVNELIEDCAESLGIKDGIIKGDIVFKNEKPYIIEVAARLSGGDFSETLIPHSTNYDFIGSAIELSIGNKEVNLPKPNFIEYVANRYFIPEKGQLIDIDIDKNIYKNEWLLKLDIRMKVDDISNGVNSNVQRAGVFIVKAKSVEDIQKRIDKVYNAVNFKYRNL